MHTKVNMVKPRCLLLEQGHSQWPKIKTASIQHVMVAAFILFFHTRIFIIYTATMIQKNQC